MKQAGVYYLTDQCYDYAASCQRAGIKWHLRVSDGNGCTNCGGVGCLSIEAEVKNEKSFTILENMRYISVDVKSYPCPVCNDDTESRMQALWFSSGLDNDETGWHVEYIDGMIGKDGALQAAHELLAMTPSPCGWLTLFGTYGVGKTGLLKSLVAGFVRAGVSARYVLAADILNELYATMHDSSGDSLTDILRRYESYKVLAIDEVGTDRIPDTQFAQSQLMRVFNSRYDSRNGKATIFATNDAPEKMRDSLGYLADRMRDGKRIPLGGDSLRGKR